MRIRHALIITSLLILAGCSGSGNREKLVDKQWLLISLNVDPPMRGTNNLYDILSPCEKDDVETFFSDGSYTWDKGEIPCDNEMDEGKLTRGNWQFKGEDDNIILLTDNEGETLELTIQTVTDTSLIMTYTEQHGEIDYTFTDIYKLKE